MLVVESGYADAAVLDLEELDLEVLPDYGQQLGVDEGFAACSGIDQRAEFELYAVLRKMAFGCECWSTEDIVQSDTVSAWGFVGCSLGLLWAGDFAQSYSFSGIGLKSSLSRVVSVLSASS